MIGDSKNFEFLRWTSTSKSSFTRVNSAFSVSSARPSGQFFVFRAPMTRSNVLLFLFFAGFFSLGYGQEIVEYKEQSITITNADVRKNEIRAGVQGIQLTCYAIFKYGDNNIKGAEESDYLRQYYFFLEIKKGDNSDRIFYPMRNPDQENKETTFDEYFKVRVTDAGKYYVRIFIPYHLFQLIPGFHNVNISLSVCDEKAKYFWRNLYQTDLYLEQPTTYLARITLKNTKLVDKKYDRPANKIPFFGLFTGGKKSKAGQGLPDASWKVKVGNDIMYESPINKNSLEVLSGSATFKISKGDPVKLIVFDEDYFKSDQEVGTINYYSTNDIGKDERTNFAFDDVETADIIFEKTVIPSISSMVLEYHVKKHEGVTGIEVEILYVMVGLQKEDAVMLRPVFRNKNGKTIVPSFIKLVETDFEMNASTGNLVTKKNGPAKQVFFIPHYACLPDIYPGIEFIMDNYNEVIQSQFSRNKLPSFGIIKDDINIQVAAAEENSYNGYWGLKFPVVIDIPEMYYDDLKYSDIENSVRIFMDDTFEITNQIQIISFFGDTALGYFHMRKIKHSKTVHIPYSYLNLSNTKHRVTIYTFSEYLGDQTIINKDTFNLEIANPELLSVVPFDLKFRIKDKTYEKGFARIYRGKTLLSTLSLQEIPKGRKYKFKADISKFLFHENDELRIEIVGIDYFKTEKILYKRLFNPLEINYNIIPETRKKSKTVKGIRIQRSKKQK